MGRSGEGRKLGGLRRGRGGGRKGRRRKGGSRLLGLLRRGFWGGCRGGGKKRGEQKKDWKRGDEWERVVVGGGGGGGQQGSVDEDEGQRVEGEQQEGQHHQGEEWGLFLVVGEESYEQNVEYPRGGVFFCEYVGARKQSSFVVWL